MDISFITASSQTGTQSTMNGYNCWEIMYQKAGFSTLSAEDKMYLLRPGDIAIIPPDIPHKKHTDSSAVNTSVFSGHSCPPSVTLSVCCMTMNSRAQPS